MGCDRNVMGCYGLLYYGMLWDVVGCDLNVMGYDGMLRDVMGCDGM